MSQYDLNLRIPPQRQRHQDPDDTTATEPVATEAPGSEKSAGVSWASTSEQSDTATSGNGNGG